MEEPLQSEMESAVHDGCFGQGSFRIMARKQRKLLGRYMVADPGICHGKPTFVGTRIMVTQVLQQVARGMSWEAITAEWRGRITKEAIAEAVELAQRTFDDHAAEYAMESLPV
jgi:uncharacterized protein (DUF433 family)